MEPQTPEVEAQAPQRARLEMPEKLTPVFTGEARYRAAYGGRGSAKSRTFAKMLAVRGYQEPMRILCARELQNSLKESSMAEIIKAIQSEAWLARAYEIGESFIRGRNGTEFLFKGLRTNINEIKSLSGIKLAWVEEAEKVSEASWRMLLPTIREPGSEIWITWNPESPHAPVKKRFLDVPRSGLKIAKMNWRDNPWFPPELEQERRDDKLLNTDTYDHVWEGEYLTRSDAQIFNGKWVVQDFQPKLNVWKGPYYGLDFGFSQDPTAGVEVWIFDGNLYIYREAVKRQLELDDTARYLREEMPGCEEYVMRADSSRPESISFVRRGSPTIPSMPRLIGAPKWDGSIKDGIAHLRSYRKIIIHSSCREVQKEARLYQYQVDKITGDVLPVVLDAHNHTWDAIRYALEPMIARKGVNLAQLTKS